MTSPSRSLFLQRPLNVLPYTGNSFSLWMLTLLNVCAQEASVTLSSKDWEIVIQNSQYTEIDLYTIMLLEVKKRELFCISFKAVSL